jgi:hypothetical protein
MPITMKPLIDGVLLDCYAYGDMEVSEFQEMVRQMHAAADATSHVWIHMLFDSRAITSSPPVTSIMSLMRNTPTHQRVGWILNVRSPHPVVNFAADVIMQLTRQRIRSFATIHDAIEFLKTADSTIDWALLPEEYAARDAATP